MSYFPPVAVIKTQVREERACFGLWFQRDRYSRSMEGVVARRHGGRSKKLADHVFTHTQETEDGSDRREEYRQRQRQTDG